MTPLPKPPADSRSLPFGTVFVEHPDPTGERWTKALGLLIEVDRRQDGAT